MIGVDATDPKVRANRPVTFATSDACMGKDNRAMLPGKGSSSSFPIFPRRVANGVDENTPSLPMLPRRLIADWISSPYRSRC